MVGIGRYTSFTLPAFVSLRNPSPCRISGFSCLCTAVGFRILRFRALGLRALGLSRSRVYRVLDTAMLPTMHSRVVLGVLSGLSAAIEVL